MSWKNIIENSIQLILVFVGLGLYTELVLKDILIESIKTETTKIENNITTEIDNKFKKVGEVISNMPLNIEPRSEQDISPKQLSTASIESNCIPSGYTLVKTENLTRRQKKRLKID